MRVSPTFVQPGASPLSGNQDAGSGARPSRIWLVFGAALAGAGHVDGRAIFYRADILTRAATDAARGIDVGLADLFVCPGGIGHLGRLQVDGLGRSGAPLLAHDAVGGHGPRETSAAIVESGAETDRPGIGCRARRTSLSPAR